MKDVEKQIEWDTHIEHLKDRGNMTDKDTEKNEVERNAENERDVQKQRERHTNKGTANMR